MQVYVMNSEYVNLSGLFYIRIHLDWRIVHFTATDSGSNTCWKVFQRLQVHGANFT